MYVYNARRHDNVQADMHALYVPRLVHVSNIQAISEDMISSSAAILGSIIGSLVNVLEWKRGEKDRSCGSYKP